jgi:nuclease S1
LGRILLAGLLLAAAVNAYAWGRDAHRLVAELTMERLTPAARAEVERLLTLEHEATLTPRSLAA